MDYRQLEIKRWPQTVRVEWSREESEDTDSTPLDYEGEDSERVASWRAGDWHMIGIRARATIYAPIGSDSFSVFEVASPGLWAIESDSDAAHLASIFDDEKAGLRDALKAIGLAFAGQAPLIETGG